MISVEDYDEQPKEVTRINQDSIMDKQLNIRISSDLIEQVRATAKRDKRSLAKQVEYILQNYLAHHPSDVSNEKPGFSNQKGK